MFVSGNLDKFGGDFAGFGLLRQRLVFMSRRAVTASHLVGTAKMMIPSVVMMAVVVVSTFPGCEGRKQIDAPLPAGKRVGGPDQPKLAPVASSLRGELIYTHALKTIAFDPHGTLLATGNGDGRVQLWTVADGRLERSIQAHLNWAFSVSFSPDGQLLASGGGDNVVRVWDVATGEKRHELAGHTDDVHAVVFLGDSRHLASASDDKTVRIWDLATGNVDVLTGHTRQVTAMAVRPDGKLLATASHDGTVRLWNSKTGEHVRTLEGHEADVVDVAFGKEGGKLATASYDKTARLWNVQTGEPLRTFSGPDDWVFAVALSPDGAKLATGSGDKNLWLWNVPTGKAEHVIWIGADISDLDYAPDGHMLAVVSTDGTVRLFDVTGDLPRQTSQLGAAATSPSEHHTSKSTGTRTSTTTATAQEYVTLHHHAMAPGDNRWKTAMTKLANVGDGFTVQFLRGLDKSKLSPEDLALLTSTVETVSKRVSIQDADDVAAAIQSRFERAATADLQCDPLEGQLVPWAGDSIRPYLGEPVVRHELERIRDHYESGEELVFGSFKSRVRGYAARLLTEDPAEATR